MFLDISSTMFLDVSSTNNIICHHIVVVSESYIHYCMEMSSQLPVLICLDNIEIAAVNTVATLVDIWHKK